MYKIGTHQVNHLLTMASNYTTKLQNRQYQYKKNILFNKKQKEKLYRNAIK